MEQIARERYEGKHKAGELDHGYIAQTYKELTKGAAQGYGKKFENLLDENGEPSPEVIAMRRNLYKFSMVKDYAMLEELNKKLSGGNNVMRWEEFRDEALKLNQKYNLNYLQAEWQTALQSGKHAADWEFYQSRKDIYPNLRYKTQGDKRVRPEHQKLEGIIAPVDGSFWKSFYPPNGWRCRCYVVQTAETATKDIPEIPVEEVRPEFRINTGITGEIFKETSENKGKPHPYFALANNADNETKKAFEYAKLAAAPHTIYKGKNGGRVRLNVFTDKRTDELLGNYRDAKSIVDEYGVDVILRAHLDGKIIKNISNPEYEIDGMLADRKTPESQNYKNILRKAAAQKCVYVVINNAKNKDVEHNIRTNLRNILKHKNVHPTIEYIILILNKKIVQIKREEI